jgi:hypothetical protein
MKRFGVLFGQELAFPLVLVEHISQDVPFSRAILTLACIPR